MCGCWYIASGAVDIAEEENGESEEEGGKTEVGIKKKKKKKGRLAITRARQMAGGQVYFQDHAERAEQTCSAIIISVYSGVQQ